MICSACGHANDPQTKFCASCGKTFDAPKDGPSAQCNGCGATVHGPPGAMKCMYCGARVDIPMSAATPAAPSGDDEDLAELERMEREEAERARRHDRYEEDTEEKKPDTSSSGVVLVGIIGAVIAVFVIAVVAGTHSRKKTETRVEKKSASTSITPTKTAKPAKPAFVDSIVISSCRCAFGDGQSTPQVTLTLRAPPLADPSRPLSLGIERQSGFVSESTSASLSLPAGTVLSGAMPTHMGVACDTGIYVLVADKIATGWSSVNASWKWNTTLPAALVEGADAGAAPSNSGTSFGGYCTPLAVQNGNATFALANGRRATLSLKDGKLR